MGWGSNLSGENCSEYFVSISVECQLWATTEHSRDSHSLCGLGMGPEGKCFNSLNESL